MSENTKNNMEDMSLTDDLFERVGTKGLSGEELGKKALTYWADVWRRFRENKLVQEAVSRAEKILERRHQEKTRSDASKTDMKKEEKKQAKKEDMCL